MRIRLQKSSLKKIQVALNPELGGDVVKTDRICPFCNEPIYRKKGRGRPRLAACLKFECQRRQNRSYMKDYMRTYNQKKKGGRA